MWERRGLLALCGAALTVPFAAWGRDLDVPVTAAFDPTRTRVFAVGVLTWADGATFGAFAPELRRDAQLVEAWVARGVPRGQITYLQDNAATRDAVVAGFAEAVRATRPGELLWLYYAGHGVRDSLDATDDSPEGTFLVPYDGTADTRATCWSLRAVADVIARDFRGAAALLTADCCHAGGLVAEVLDRLAVPAAVLASSVARAESTGAWTFSDCLLDGVGGCAAADRDHDGTVTFADVAAHAAARLAYLDHQRSVSAVRRGFLPNWVLGPSVVASAAGEGEAVEVRSEGRWYRAMVLQRGADGRVLVRYAGYTHVDDEWVEAARVRRSRRRAV